MVISILLTHGFLSSCSQPLWPGFHSHCASFLGVSWCEASPCLPFCIIIYVVIFRYWTWGVTISLKSFSLERLLGSAWALILAGGEHVGYALLQGIVNLRLNSLTFPREGFPWRARSWPLCGCCWAGRQVWVVWIYDPSSCCRSLRCFSLQIHSGAPDRPVGSVVHWGLHHNGRKLFCLQSGFAFSISFASHRNSVRWKGWRYHPHFTNEETEA